MEAMLYGEEALQGMRLVSLFSREIVICIASNEKCVFLASVEKLAFRYGIAKKNCFNEKTVLETKIKFEITIPSAVPFPMKSAFSPLCPTSVFGARYPYMQQSPQVKRFLAAPYSGTGFLTTVLQDQEPESNENGTADAD